MNTALLNRINETHNTTWFPYRDTKCLCHTCNNPATIMQPLLKRGGTGEVGIGGGGMCLFHHNGGLEDTAYNPAIVGHPMHHGLSFRCIWDLDGVSSYATAQLLVSDILPTEYGFISPLCFSLCHIAKIENLISALIASGDIKTFRTNPILEVQAERTDCNYAPVNRFLENSDFEYYVFRQS